MISSRAKQLRASAILIKSLRGGSPLNRPRIEQTNLLSLELKRDGVAKLSCFCILGPSCRVGNITSGHSFFSNIAVANSSDTSDADGLPGNEESEGHPSSSKDVKTREAHWERMFGVLKEYQSIHGDTLVPASYPENPSLGMWVDNQRQWYRMRAEGLVENGDAEEKRRARIMTDKKIEQLNSIGFVWNLYERIWNIRYEELKEYVAENGNTLVPSTYPQNESLALWVMRQRRTYKLRHEYGEKDGADDRIEAILSEDRIRKLNELGFVWDVYEAQWLEWLEDMKVYRMNHGDTLVPQKYSSPHGLLGKWVDKQRNDYRNYIQKKKIEDEWRGKDVLDEVVKKKLERLKRLCHGMTEERIQLLESEDFIWDPLAYAWDSKFDELCDFVALNGHAAVFRGAGARYDPLARWAEHQRKNYEKYQEGQKTTLTEERIARLNSVHFVWENPKKRRRRRKK